MDGFSQTSVRAEQVCYRGQGGGGGEGESCLEVKPTTEDTTELEHYNWLHDFPCAINHTSIGVYMYT